MSTTHLRPIVKPRRPRTPATPLQSLSSPSHFSAPGLAPYLDLTLRHFDAKGKSAFARVLEDISEQRIAVMDAAGDFYLIKQDWIAWNDPAGAPKIHHSTIPAGKGVAAAGIEELSGVKGMSRDLAAKIYAAFHG